MAMKILKTIVPFLLMSGTAAAGTLNIDGAVLDESGTTVITTCRNTQGYFRELGSPAGEPVLYARGFANGVPVTHALTALVPAGWQVVVGRSVPKKKRISWRREQPWTGLLKQIAHDYNLAVIVDWDRRSVFVDRL